MSKWEMGYGSTLEQRTKKNSSDIDMQWIKESETNELFKGKFFSDPTQSSSKKSLEELEKEIVDLLSGLDRVPTTSEERCEGITELMAVKKELDEHKMIFSLEGLKTNEYGGENLENNKIDRVGSLEVDAEFEKILKEINQVSGDAFSSSSERKGR